MLLNLTNHPMAFWPSAQRVEAERRWGPIRDLPFPAVAPDQSTSAVVAQANALVQQAMALHPDAVLCQGEMTMTVALVCAFQQAGIPVYAACSHRQATVEKEQDGAVRKTSTFRFIQFRAYPKIP